MLRKLKGRIERWLRRRDRPPQNPVNLGRRRIYILPTRAGLIFAIVLLAMFIGATNYANSLAFLLTFTLASVGTLGMWHTQRNLLDVRVSASGAEPVFAGQEARFKIRLENTGGRAKNAVGIRTRSGSPVFADLGPNGAQVLEVRVHASSRGLLRLDRLTAFTNYPIGLFEAWSWVDLDMEAMVYPRPVGTLDSPPALGGSKAHAGPPLIGHDDFDHLRSYHPGDSPKHVAWKASARGSDLLTKRFLDAAGRLQVLDWKDTPGSDPESKLSQLALWLINADASGIQYALSLPGSFVAADSGPLHRSRCLRSLALWGSRG